MSFWSLSAWNEFSMLTVHKIMKHPYHITRECYTPKQGFSTSALLIFWARWFYVVKGCLVRCRLFSSTSGLYPLDARATFSIHICDNWESVRTRPNVPWGAKLPPVENYCSKVWVWISADVGQVLYISKVLTMSVNTPGLIRLIIFATWKTSTAFSFSSCWERVVRAHNIPAETAPYLGEEKKKKDVISDWQRD